ncbi:DUF2795 domain-containing protein [Halobacteria archaeon AArc-dxtr1]|nr:DUF2795 domain-containing protein [Halobacteria archaeon AArc-dxtr1]
MFLNRTGSLLAEHEYPATTDDLIDAYGDRTLDLQNGTETLAEVLSRSEPETFQTAEDAQFALYAAVSRKAIGRVGYSDRDPEPPGSPDTHDIMSI